MSEQAVAQSESLFKVPTNMQEFAALALSLLSVFVLIQVGAPIIRELDFLDQKLRDYFMGISFAAFPMIHRGCKKGLASFTAQAPERHDLTPWFVSGVIAATLLFAWNQFVSFLGSFAIAIVLGQIQGVDLNASGMMGVIAIGALAVALPLSAAASILAGIVLNRHTRSHVFAALALAAVCFVALNASLTWLLQPDFLIANWNAAAASGPEGVLLLLLGVALVPVVVFVFGTVGIFISRFNRERSIGRLMEAARRLPSAERDILAADITRRLEASAQGAKFQMAGSAEP